MTSKTVYLTYRPDHTPYLALALYHSLAKRGYDVYLSHEATAFSQRQLLTRVYFLAIITPPPAEETPTATLSHSFRQQLIWGVTYQRVIVPIVYHGFNFYQARSQFEGILEPILHQNALMMYTALFEDVVQRLIAQFLMPPPPFAGILRRDTPADQHALTSFRAQLPAMPLKEALLQEEAHFAYALG